MQCKYYLETREIYYKFHEIMCRPILNKFIAERRKHLKNEDEELAMK